MFANGTGIGRLTRRMVPDLKTKHKELGPTDQFARAFVFDVHVFLSRGRRMDGDLISKAERYWTLEHWGGCMLRVRRPILCFIPGSLFGNGDQHQKHWAHMIAGRCHLGAFPGHGMLIASDSGCDCDPIRGMAAYGSEAAPSILEPITLRGKGNRVQGGVRTIGQCFPGCQAQRMVKLLSPPVNSWTSGLGKASTGDGLEIRRYDITAGSMGAPPLREIAVVTRPHDHEVVHFVEGRIRTLASPGHGAFGWRGHLGQRHGRLRFCGRMDRSRIPERRQAGLENARCTREPVPGPFRSGGAATLSSHPLPWSVTRSTPPAE